MDSIETPNWTPAEHMRLTDALITRLVEAQAQIEELEAAVAALRENDGPSFDRPTFVKLGERLRRRRRSMGLNQTHAALLLGVDQATVSKWERGDRPDVLRIRRLAEFLQAMPSEIADSYLEEFGNKDE